MTWCRTIEEVEAAGAEAGRNDPPLSQAQADLVAAILAPYRHLLDQPKLSGGTPKRPRPRAGRQAAGATT
jgi:hypothetical protein